MFADRPALLGTNALLKRSVSLRVIRSDAGRHYAVAVCVHVSVNASVDPAAAAAGADARDVRMDR